MLVGIVGGGACGLSCASVLEKYKIDYLIFERSNKIGSKILASGNGRCNIFNKNLIDSKTFNYDLLLNFLKENECPLVVDDEGRYYPLSNSSKTILDLFLSKIDKNKIILNTPILKIEKINNKYKLADKIVDKLVLASGSVANIIKDKQDVVYGYLKSPEDNTKWIVDEPAAKIVRKIFDLCIQGYGTTQIARILKEENIMTPTEYRQSIGLKTNTKLQDVKHYWNNRTIGFILDRQEYIGDTVNFRTTKRSFKDHTKVFLPKEQWKIFKNTHEPIIDEETWNTVQRIRSNKRRTTKTGKVSIFSGHLFCKDCGAKLYYCTANNFTPDKDFYRCSNYKNNSTKSCTSHNIKDIVLRELVLANIKQVISYISSYEDLFIKEKLVTSLEEQQKENITNKKLLSQYEKRVKEIDNLIQHIYEDNISGKITDDRFATLSFNYEKEQKDLKEKINELSTTIDKTKQKEIDLTAFIDKVKKYTEIKELTPEIVNELIDKIYVYQQTKLNGKKYQQIDIYYAGVGIIGIPLTEYELENAFQQSIKNIKTA